ncbi:hypothetical protein FAGAP_2687 [Fusarium agapanthi]|uniref:ARCA protein n=1 Tax=Fusarium agapanthi TaxID=1803897 RepID=A0A9P5BF55_9HYPO|nr:hypothetical protein FAGAP_2687 [Fusarium agapanthi]
MALEHRLTKFSLHEQAKDVVSSSSRPKNPNGLPYELAVKPEDFPTIPDPGVFKFPTPTNSSNAPSRKRTTPDLALPTLSECAAHLEFLETLFILRQRILVSTELDDVMQTKPVRETKTGAQGDEKTLKDDKLWERRQAKWLRFVELATVRFLAWREHFNKSSQREITRHNLPPLDILMVWHSFLLNPRIFFNTCSEEPLFSVKFPWKHIHHAIDNTEWAFTLPPAAAANYEEASGFAPNLFNDILAWKDLASTTLIHMSHTGFGLFREYDTELAKQLRDAVIRQASFVDKMNSFMWIRSPAFEGTIRRAIARYQNFCKLLKISKTTVVPTLDIDLIWHTHQCMAKHYGQAMKVLAGKFVNHDDTIEKPQLGDGFGETRRLYRVYFGQEYRACGCWDCQALLTELERAVEEGQDVDMDKITAKTLSKGNPQTPDEHETSLRAEVLSEAPPDAFGTSQSHEGFSAFQNLSQLSLISSPSGQSNYATNHYGTSLLPAFSTQWPHSSPEEDTGKHCISHLMGVSADPINSCSDDALAAITILRYREQVDTHFTGTDNENFSIVVRDVFQASQNDAYGLLHLILQPPRGSDVYVSLSSLRFSACLIALRQEIWSVLMHCRPFRLPILPVESYGIFDDTLAADDYDWTNRVLIWCAPVLKFCYPDDDDEQSTDNRTRHQQWEAIKDFQRNWDEKRPPHFAPLYYRERNLSEGRYFPECWIPRPCQMLALQHIELARIVLAVHDTKIQLSIGGRAAHKALEELMREATRRVCGLAMSQKRCQEGMVTAAVGLSMCGEYFQDQGEQAAIMELVTLLERDHAWPTSNLLKKLWDT